MRKKTTWAIALFSLVLSGLAFGQGNQTSTISVSVTDSNGGPLPGVVILVESPSLQGTRSIVTNDSGKALATLLPVGDYTVTVTMPGFQTQKWEGRASLGNITPLKFKMQASSVEEVLTVIAEKPAIDPTDSTTKSNFESEEMDKLPVSRNPIVIARLTPGTSTNNNTGNLSIHGGNGASNLMLVDGSEFSDNVYNSFRSSLVINESIEETQVLTSGISAEYGRFDGGVVNVVTKSGSNEISGALRYTFTNPSWAASTPLVADAESKLNKNPEFTMGGPIIKDRLWFFVAYYTNDVNDNSTYTDSITRDVNGNLLPIEQRKGTYNYASETERYQVKLTYSPNPNHRIAFNYTENDNAQNLRNYVGAGEPAALVPQDNVADVWKITYNGIITPNLAITANYGKKHQNLSAGGNPTGTHPFYTIDYAGAFEGYDYSGNVNVFENGWFNKGDGGDTRDNTTGVVKLSYFLDTAMGFHNIDFGGDYYKGERQAANHQSPTMRTVDAFGRRITPDGTVQYFLFPYYNSIWVYTSAREGYATSEQYGLYINDRWEVNDRLTLNLGVRYDSFDAKDELGSSNASSDGIAPRLSANYDLTGDGKFFLNATYGVFNGKLLETITNAVTSQGNPKEVDYFYVGDPGWFTAEEIDGFLDTAYDYSNDGVAWFGDPLLGTYIDPDLEPQQSTEYTIGFNWNINSTDYLTFNYINREWDGFYDTLRTSDDYSVSPEGILVYDRYYTINKNLVREYEGIEITGAWNGKGGWMENLSVGFNATISDLQGNHEGEGSSNAAVSNGIIGDFEAEWNALGYNINNQLAPMGALNGDVPLVANAWLGYGLDFGRFGMLDTSLLFQYADGETYSDVGIFTTPNDIRALNGSRTTSIYHMGERGTSRYAATRTYDLGLRYNVPIFKKVQLFVEGNVYNLMNSRHVLRWNTTWVVDNDMGTDTAADDTWRKGDTYGDPTSYLRGRSWDLAAGFRF